MKTDQINVLDIRISLMLGGFYYYLAAEIRFVTSILPN